MEKQHFQKVQELHGGGISSNNTRQSDEGLVLNLDEEDEVEMSRSKEVQQLAQSITELSVLFKDLNALVVEQGTVLDRIDFNIQEAKSNTQQANVHLDSALKIEKSMRSQKVIIGLAIGILVLSIILILRWTS